MCWYVNDFGGIDLNFASSIKRENRVNSKGKNVEKYVLDDSAYFGGILIRQLISEDGCEVLNGPWACAELFRCYDATDVDHEFPILVEHDNGMVGYIRKPRVNLLTSQQTVEGKVNYILSEYHEYTRSEGLYGDFASFLKKRYRYVRCETLMHDKDTNIVFFSPWLIVMPSGSFTFFMVLSPFLFVLYLCSLCIKYIIEDDFIGRCNGTVKLYCSSVR